MYSNTSSSNNRNELQSIQEQIHEKKTGILESTRRMLGLINESEVTAVETNTQLVEQHEKLADIERRCDNIDSNLVQAQQNINKLGSLFGGIKNYFHPPKSSFSKSASQPQISNANKKPNTTTNTPVRATNVNDNHDTYFGKSRNEMDDIERETDDGLRDVHLGVGRLKELAWQMNQELISQQPLTDRLGKKIGILNDEVNKKNKALKAQLT